MTYPKGFRKNIKLIKDKVGFERRQEILDDISDYGTFLPRGVLYEDMDKSFVDFIKEDMKLNIDGEVVPVIFLTIQRWSEFNRTWQHSDEYKNIKIPFITIVREPNPQPGKNQAGLFNIPGRRSYTYIKVPTFEGGRKGVDMYKIPQPTSVDITYTVRVFCNKMRDLNKFNLKIQQAFNSIQYYINVKGHPMPLLLENIGDESNIDDFENRRFYVQPYEIRLQGYVLDEDDFEVIPTINRTLVFNEVVDSMVKPIFRVDVNDVNNKINYNIIFKPNSENEFKFISKFNVSLINFSYISKVNNIIIIINNVEVFNGLKIQTPINVKNGDEVKIKIERNVSNTSKFTINGNII